MRRGKLSVHVADVKAVLKSFAVEIQATSVDVKDVFNVGSKGTNCNTFVTKSNGCQL
jgi:hypothetical protein